MTNHQHILQQLDIVQVELGRLRELLQEAGEGPLCTVRKSRTARSFDQVTAAVSQYYGLSIDDLFSRSRIPELVWPRQLACWLMTRHVATASTSAIGRHMARSQWAVVNSIHQVENRISCEPSVVREIEAVQNLISEKP